VKETMAKILRVLFLSAFLCDAVFLFAQEESMIHDSFTVGENIAVNVDIALTETSLNVELTLENRGTANAMLYSEYLAEGLFLKLISDGEVRSGYYQEDGTLLPPLHAIWDWRFKPEMTKVLEPGQKINFIKQLKIIRTQTTFVVLGRSVDNVFYSPKWIRIEVKNTQLESDTAKMEKLDFTDGAVVVPNFEKTYLLAEFD
jgi:hypothetical protein